MKKNDKYTLLSNFQYMRSIWKKLIQLSVIAIIFFVLGLLYFNFSLVNENLVSGMLIYSGLLIVFIAFLINLHYKELHSIAILENKKYEGESIDFFNKSLAHNRLILLALTVIVVLLISSGILNIINLQMLSSLFLDSSYIILLSCSILVVTILVSIFFGKINDANNKV